MKHSTLIALTSLFLAAGSASAQFGSPGYGNQPGSPYRGPQLSPYLNLLRGNNNTLGSASANYFLGVVPERDRRANATQFGSALQSLERREQNPTDPANDLMPELSQTGHPAYFSTYGSYYNFGGQNRLGSFGSGTVNNRRTR